MYVKAIIHNIQFKAWHWYLEQEHGLLLKLLSYSVAALSSGEVSKLQFPHPFDKGRTIFKEKDNIE